MGSGRAFTDVFAGDGDDLVEKGSNDTGERTGMCRSEEMRKEEMGPWGQ